MGKANVCYETLCLKLKQIREGKSEYRRGKAISAETISNMIYEYKGRNSEYLHDRSYYRDIEENKRKPETIMEYANLYFEVLNIPQESRIKILQSNKIVVVDTSALMNMPHLVKQLETKYHKIIVPNIVINELETIKNKKNDFQKSKKARKTINELNDCEEKVVNFEYDGEINVTNDEIIRQVAKEAYEKYLCETVILTANNGFKTHYLGKETNHISVLALRDYAALEQHIVPENLDVLQSIRDMKSGCYDNVIFLSKKDMNSFFIDGRTLLSACVTDKTIDFERKKSHIKWLIEKGANINQNDCGPDYFSPLASAVQLDDYKMVEFLLDECNADPNVFSKYPYNFGTIGMQNQGNTPLMIASYQGLEKIVEKLLSHPDISINQQDRNGYTALIKASMNGYTRCRDLLIDKGADKKIIDMKGFNAEHYYDDYKSKNSCINDSEKQYQEELKKLNEKYGKI